MATVEFGAGQTPVENTASPAEPQAEQAQTQALARPFSVDYIPTFKNVILPSLNIAHPVGDIGKVHTHGSIVFDNRIKLFEPADIDLNSGTVKRPSTGPFTVTFLGFETPSYLEKVKGGFGGLRVATEQEVRAAGGTLDYKEWELKKASGMKYFEPTTKSMVVIERPAHLPDDGSLFVHEINGLKYTLAFWTFKATGYTAACSRVLFPARLTGCLQRGYETFSFSASAKLTPFRNGNSSWLPVLVPNKPSTPEFLAFAKQVLQG